MPLQDIFDNLNASINHAVSQLRTEQPLGSPDAMMAATAALGIGGLFLSGSLLFGGISLAAQLAFYATVTCYSLEAFLCKGNVTEEIKKTINDLSVAFNSVEGAKKFFRDYIAGGLKNRINFVKNLIKGNLELHSLDSSVSTVARAAFGYLGFISAQAFVTTAIFSTLGLAINVAVGACLACSTAYALNLCVNPDDWNRDIDAFTNENTSLLGKIQMLIQGPINNVKKQLGFVQQCAENVSPALNAVVNSVNSGHAADILDDNPSMTENASMLFSLAETVSGSLGLAKKI